LLVYPICGDDILLLLIFFNTAVDELVAHGQLGETAKAKLRRVVNWVRHTESALRHVQKAYSCQVLSITL